MQHNLHCTRAALRLQQQKHSSLLGQIQPSSVSWLKLKCAGKKSSKSARERGWQYTQINQKQVRIRHTAWMWHFWRALQWDQLREMRSKQCCCNSNQTFHGDRSNCTNMTEVWGLHLSCEILYSTNYKLSQNTFTIKGSIRNLVENQLQGMREKQRAHSTQIKLISPKQRNLSELPLTHASVIYGRSSTTKLITGDFIELK